MRLSLMILGCSLRHLRCGIRLRYKMLEGLNVTYIKRLLPGDQAASFRLLFRAITTFRLFPAIIYNRR